MRGVTVAVNLVAMTPEEPRWVAREDLPGGRPRGAAAVRFPGLWLTGSADGLDLPTVAVVGSRAPSEAGRALAHETGRALAQAGACVLSGLALGIDGSAHAGALAGGGPTIGVLGGGHACFHPRRNRALAARMVEAGGGVLSPFEPRHPAFPGQFLQRNGIVAALADAVVIVEAAGRSGALNTASWAADLGLPVLAFPGDVDRPKVAGCLALIRDGATLVRSPADVLADLGLAAAEVRLPKPPAPPSDPLQAELLRALGAGEAPLDDLLDATGGRTAEVLGALTLLEVAGSIERRPGQRYAARPGGTAARRGR